VNVATRNRLPDAVKMAAVDTNWKICAIDRKVLP